MQFLNEENWRAAQAQRCRVALEAASAPADRVALLRSLARLEHGRLDLRAEGFGLSEGEEALLARFGLSHQSYIVRIVDEDVGVAPRGYFAAERLDTSSRRLQSAATPDAVLLRHTKHRHYSTASQKAAVRAVVTMPDGASLMVCMPTGSGKSLLFQLEALRRRQAGSGACLAVITPTVSLSLDHERTLAGIPGLEGSRALTGEMAPKERHVLLDQFRRGEVPILLLSPELALGGARAALVEAASPQGSKLPGLNGQMHMLVIDEAHIVESWGRSFRPDFQRLPALVEELRKKAPELKVLLLSATLPAAARTVLRNTYGAGKPWLEVNSRAPRYEFDLVVQSYSELEERLAALDFVIDRAPRPLIIYTTLVDEPNRGSTLELCLSATTIFDRLKASGYQRIGLFTGKVRAAGARQKILQEWADDHIDIVVATSAFGMGVDKPNVRTVLHACLPEGPARFYQEIGRASRDGHQGLGICLFSVGSKRAAETDVDLAYSQATGSWLTRELAEARWLAMFEKAIVEWHDASQRLRLDLDARHYGLKGQRSGDQNRVWNMSLLNLMQRSGVLQVVAVDESDVIEGPAWTIEVRDPRLLGSDSGVVWDRIFTVRDAEQYGSRNEVDRFLSVMRRPESECLLRAIFEQIDEDVSRHVPVCGRCPSCRSQGHEAPTTLVSEGLEQFWKIGPSGSTALFPGIIIVAPEDPTFETGMEALLRGLSQVGIDQFCVPDNIADIVAAHLARSNSELGLVLRYGEFLNATPAAELSLLSTAVLLPQEEQLAARLLKRSTNKAANWRDLSLVLVGAPHRIIEGRRLDQSASNFAPFHESLLAQL